MDEIERMGADAFADALAKGMSEDPDQQILIKEGIRAGLFRRSEAAGQLIGPRSMSRFVVEERDDGTTVLWDFYTLAVYMGYLEVRPGENKVCSSRVYNARNAEFTELSPPMTYAFYVYLRENNPGFKIRNLEAPQSGE